MSSISLCRSYIVSRFLLRMSSTQSYKDAIHKLNSLQSNKANINQIRVEIKKNQICRTLDDMVGYLSRTGITLSKLDELPVIHVAGTKGKGSTSAMCESILRQHGFRTGFYSSPHLVAVRERIRIDGEVISEETFAKHFHRVYDMLEATQGESCDMPKYFGFLTVLAYNVFVRARVDVAVVEVGIGGVHDHTNVIRKVPVVGITALGLDHTAILGSSLAEIAWAKAGIMKPGCQAFTVPQPPDAMAVLRQVAAHVGCTLNVSPAYTSYKFPRGQKARLQAELDAYYTNASLAIQLAHAWMKIAKAQLASNLIIKQTVNGKYNDSDFLEKDSEIALEKVGRDVTLVSEVPYDTMVGLESCRWPGRYQVISTDYATFYLDGAHTKDSMHICAKWFNDCTRYHKKILIFSSTGDRDDTVLLTPLSNIKFQSVFFVIPTAFADTNKNNDNFYSTNERKESLATCNGQKNIWNKLKKESKYAQIFTLGCVEHALEIIKKSNNCEETAILLTGSLHLVGAALSILDPCLSFK